MIQRILSVILSMLLILTACQQSEAPPIDDIVGDISFNPLVYTISLDLQWVSPNPGERWGDLGREIQVMDNITTRITIRIDAKNESEQDFETVLASITAEDVTIETTNAGQLYGRGTSPISDYVIYRDFQDYVVTFTLIDALSNTIDPLYINDWERIALEGNLLILE